MLFFLITLDIRPRLFKRWIALSTAKITIRQISITEINYAIKWMVIYLVDSAIQRLNNRGQKVISLEECERHE